MVPRQLPPPILSLPYPWFDFLVTVFILSVTLINLRSAGQPSAGAVSLFAYALSAFIQGLMSLFAVA
jgi:hypothetical protein